MDEVFLNEMADAVQTHLRLAYTTEIKDAHVAWGKVPMDLRHDDFCTVWREYNDGLFECIRLLIRCERSLVAWKGMIGTLDETVRLNCLADYAYPTLRVAWDIPLTFKDQLTKGIVKLEHLATGDHSLLMHDDRRRGGHYRTELEKLAESEPELSRIQDCLNNDLYSSEEARHLREMHGRAHHDTSTSLMSGKHTLVALAGYAYATAVEHPIDLEHEVRILDCQRKRLQHGYQLFGERANNLYGNLSGQAGDWG